MIYQSTYAQNTASFNDYSDFSDLFLQDDELMQSYDHFLKDNQVHGTNNMNEFEQYLSDPLVSRSGSGTFDVLVWWKENELKYPSVSSMARDVLAIPITSVASESVSKISITI